MAKELSSLKVFRMQLPQLRLRYAANRLGMLEEGGSVLKGDARTRVVVHGASANAVSAIDKSGLKFELCNGNQVWGAGVYTADIEHSAYSAKYVFCLCFFFLCLCLFCF